MGRRGFDAERDLVRKLWKCGFAVIRGPASGSRIKRAVCPDVVAIKNRNVFVFEVKKRSKYDSIYLDKEQVLKLVEFARRAGGEAFIAVKISNNPWKFIPVNKLVDVGSSYKVPRDEIEAGLDIDDLVRMCDTFIPLTSYKKRSSY
ncbi:MAG: Holliday junction resolvase [Thermoprotei archaeon]|nr:MAG: Holliday junction resolvase [Thermoprotei archaeon]